MIEPDAIPFLAIPASEKDATRFIQAFLALCRFAKQERQALAMHRERMETMGVADPKVAASLESLLREAMTASDIADKVEPMLHSAIFCQKGGTA